MLRNELRGYATSIEVRQDGKIPTFGFEQVVNSVAGFADIAEFQAGLAAAMARVARILIGGQEKGTGFLVSDSLLLTNYHVLSELTGELRGSAQFDHLRTPGEAVVRPGQTVAFAKSWEVMSSMPTKAAIEASPDGPGHEGGWDYRLIRLEAPPKNVLDQVGGRGWYRLLSEPYAFDAAEPLLIVGHPKGRPMQLSYAAPSEAQLTLHKSRLRYSTNTDEGSSGSPVFNKAFRLVALHNAWGLSPKKKFNQGVPIHLVAKDLIARLAGKPKVLAELGIDIEVTPRKRS